MQLVRANLESEENPLGVLHLEESDYVIGYREGRIEDILEQHLKDLTQALTVANVRASYDRIPF